MKRALAPVARALADDEEELPAWLHKREIDTAQSAVLGVLDDIAALTDRARSLQDELNTALAEETNRRLYIVTVVTVMLLPATFVAGFFGMNTGGLPWSGENVAHGTLMAGLACVAAVLITLALLRWK